MKLAKFQKATVDIGGLLRNKRGHGYNYADLGAVLELIFLAGDGEVAVTQSFDLVREGISITTRVFGIDELPDPNVTVVPESWLEIKKSKEGKDVLSKAQTDGSAITYARRYAISALLGIAPVGDDDRSLLEDTIVKRTNYDQLAQKAIDNAPETKSAPQLPEKDTSYDDFVAFANEPPTEDGQEKQRRGRIICRRIDLADDLNVLSYVEEIANTQGLGKPGSTIEKRIAFRKTQLSQKAQ